MNTKGPHCPAPNPYTASTADHPDRSPWDAGNGLGPQPNTVAQHVPLAKAMLLKPVPSDTLHGHAASCWCDGRQAATAPGLCRPVPRPGTFLPGLMGLLQEPAPPQPP